MNAVTPIRRLLVMLFLQGIVTPSGSILRPLVAAELQSIADVSSLSLEELDREPVVRVRGVVTWSQPRAILLQEGDRGLYVNIGLAIKRGITTGADFPRDMPLGTVVEAEGRISRGGLSPPLLPHELSIVGTAPLPVPRPFDAAEFFTAASLHAIVEVDAVAQGVALGSSTRPLSDGQIPVPMWMEAQGRPFLAWISRRLLDRDPADVVDAEVRLTGIVLPTFNTRGEADVPIVIVEHPESFTVTSPRPQPPFEAPNVPLRSLNSFGVRPAHGHRVRVEGTLIHAVPGESIILQDGATGVQVMTPSTLPLVPGDRVEAAGFIDLTGRVAGLHNAVIRRLGPGRPREPFRITPDEVVGVNRASAKTFIMATPGDYENCLIEFSGQLLEKHATRDGGIFVVAAGATAVTARLSAADFHATGPLLPGSEIAIDSCASRRSRHSPGARAAVGDLRAEAIALLPR